MLTCQTFVSNLPFWEAICRIANTETSANSDAFIMGWPDMRVFHVAKVGQTHKK
jgi:hypothetical protein